MARTPGPDELPLVGSVWKFFRHPLRFMTACQRAYGDVVRFNLFNQTAYLLSDPSDIGMVLSNDTVEYHKPTGRTTLQQTIGDGLLLNIGDDVWRDQRQRAQPAFGIQQIAQPCRIEAIIAYAEEMVAQWDDDAMIDVRAETVPLTVKIIVDLMFGVKIDDRTVSTIEDQLDVIVGAQSTSTIAQSMLPGFLTRADAQYEEALDKLRAVLGEIISEHREVHPIDRVRVDADSNGGRNFLSIMLTAHDRGEVDPTFLRDELMTILLAGHDTTSLAVTYAIYLLAQHPDVVDRLYDETTAVLDDQGPRVSSDSGVSTKHHTSDIGTDVNTGASTANESRVTFDDVQRLNYTQQVLDEAMRLYPPVPLIARVPQADVQLGGHRIPAGSLIFMSQWVVHRDPRWYDDPETFDPDRMARQQVNERPQYSHIPFGAGPRICIGKPLAELEAKLILSTIVQRYRFDGIEDSTLELNADVTLSPDTPVRVGISKR